MLSDRRIFFLRKTSAKSIVISFLLSCNIHKHVTLYIRKMMTGSYRHHLFGDIYYIHFITDTFKYSFLNIYKLYINTVYRKSI